MDLGFRYQEPVPDRPSGKLKPTAIPLPTEAGSSVRSAPSKKPLPDLEVPGISSQPIFETVIEDFVSTVAASARAYSPPKTLKSVQFLVLAIQAHQERVKSLMNFTRAEIFLRRLAELDRLCRFSELQSCSDELSAFIWDPCYFIFDVNTTISIAWTCRAAADIYSGFSRGSYSVQCGARCVPESWEEAAKV